jgi:ATP-binding protein involved in chromosome partitioning
MMRRGQPGPPPWHSQQPAARVEGIAHVVVVGSGKGGVGKSTVSVNLAVALARRGLRVGLLDGDAYGPSVPLMLGVRKRELAEGWAATLPLGFSRHAPQQHMQPLVRYGVQVMSVGFFIGEEQAVAPMPDVLGLLIRQLVLGVAWGELDVLLIDLPPGTAEPQATLCRELALDGALLVTTPQDVARVDTAKAAAMLAAGKTSILGLVENMSGFVCPHCGERVEIFPRSAEARDAGRTANAGRHPARSSGGGERRCGHADRRQCAGVVGSRSVRGARGAGGGAAAGRRGRCRRRGGHPPGRVSWTSRRATPGAGNARASGNGHFCFRCPAQDGWAECVEEGVSPACRPNRDVRNHAGS